jgi:hypothetical protein
MHQLVMALLLVIATRASGSAVSAHAVSGTCAPKDVRSERLIANLKAFVGKNDMGGTIEKTTMGVKDVTPAQVSLVTDKAICAKAAAAFDKKLIPDLRRPAYALYVVTLGSSFAVEDTVSLQAGFETADIFDSNWKYIGVRQIHSNSQ